MKRQTFLFLALFLAASGVAKAQFAKPLRQANASALVHEANYSVGIVGGINATRWFMSGVTNMEQPLFLFDNDSVFKSLRNHALAGIVVERRLGDYNSVGIEAMYAHRWTKMAYEYEVGGDDMGGLMDPTDLTYRHQDSALYREITIQVPLTQYILGPDHKLRPFLFVAPRVSLPLDRHIIGRKQALTPAGSPIGSTINAADSLANLTVGAVAGVGLRYRIDVGSYYLLLKIDASCHFGLLNAHFAATPNSTDAGRADTDDSQTIGPRRIGNATAKLTLLFPLRKRNSDACRSWGEYD